MKLYFRTNLYISGKLCETVLLTTVVNETLLPAELAFDKVMARLDGLNVYPTRTGRQSCSCPLAEQKMNNCHSHPCMSSLPPVLNRNAAKYITANRTSDRISSNAPRI
jgi:hypothetical protein